jgi:drug/metabolite transporter (DMT)-like permease
MPGDSDARHHDTHLHLESPEVPAGLGSLADAFIDPAKEHDRQMHAITLADYGLILGSVLIAACGQLMLRYGMTRVRSDNPGVHKLNLLLAAARSPWVVGGLTVFGVSAMLWLITLSKVPLSRAYPFTAVGFIAILAASSILLDEVVGPRLWIGALVVVGGLLLIVSDTPDAKPVASDGRHAVTAPRE